MYKSVSIIFTALLCTSLNAADPELKGSPAELAAYLANLPRVVSVAGESEVKVPADRAALTLKVITESKSLLEALQMNQEIRGRMIASLKERGVPADRVQASKFSSSPRRGIFTEKAKSYRIENLVKVSVQDEREFQAVARVVDGSAEIHYLNVDFEHTDKEALKKKALTQALDNAAERKRMFEERLGVKLQPKSFSHSLDGPPIAKPVNRYPMEYSSSDKRTRVTALPEMAQEVSEEAGSVFGELVFTARVAVEYSVEPR